MNLLDQSAVTGGGLDLYNALFVNRTTCGWKDLEITIVLFKELTNAAQDSYNKKFCLDLCHFSQEGQRM